MSTVPLELDFRRPGGASGRRAGWWMLLAAILLATVAADRHAEIAERHADADSRHGRLEDRLHAGKPKRSSTLPDPVTTAELQRANVVIEQLAVPWEDLFGAIEAANTSKLAILSLTPNARDHSVRLTGETRSMDDLLAYVGRLDAHPALGRVHLQGYNTVVREGAAVIAFTLAASWGQP